MKNTRPLLFLLFFLSGFCSLLYQIIWTRMAFASFGIITPVLSVVLSIFMLGLSLGAWAGGRLTESWAKKTGMSVVLVYALAEFLIGLGAFATPKFFAVGAHFLLGSGQMNSVNYLFASACVLAFSILPWCLLMGATFPLMMAYVRERDPQATEGFSFLYMANVLGAMCGTLFTALVLVETFGFRHTLWVAAAGNFLIAIIGGSLARGSRGVEAPGTVVADEAALIVPPAGISKGLTRWILFSTGFAAMALEVVWTRAFTPVLSTQVYSFALVVFVYLGATSVGSMLYRSHLRRQNVWSIGALMALLAVAVFLPVLVNDPRLVHMNQLMEPGSVFLLMASIFPLCAILGYLTPRLVDEYAGGNPAAAGRAYAINVLGCILGPLFSSYILLPACSERYASILLALPFLVFFGFCCRSLSSRMRMIFIATAGVFLAGSLLFSMDFEAKMARYPKLEIRRDYAASVIAVAGNGSPLNKGLFVNGINMTTLTPVTKFMVHLPLVLHQGTPTSALLICFGMGTGYRSALSWDLNTTAVELVPGVRDSFGFFHTNAAAVLANKKGRIVVDDGRRYLKRTQDKFDIIVIDPPPPVVAAGSSLLYSTEFYELAKEHLKPNGIVQAWFPFGEGAAGQAVLRSVCDEFPYVRCFTSVEGWGMHILASREPMPVMSAEELAARMPEAAKKDLLEWDFSQDPLPAYIQRVLATEYAPTGVLSIDPDVRITDDQPYNEYFLLRRLMRHFAN